MNLIKKIILLLLINVLLFTMAYYYYRYMVDAYEIYTEKVKSNIQIRMLGFEEAVAVKFGDNVTFNSLVTSFKEGKSGLDEKLNKLGENVDDVQNNFISTN